MPRGRSLALVALTLVLVVGAGAAFVQTQTLKLERSSVRLGKLDRALSPACDCPRDTATVELRLRDPQRLGVVIVNEEDEPVRTLAASAERGAGIASFEWDGRDAAGEPVPAGYYRVRVDLPEDDRSLVMSRTIDVDVDRSTPQPSGRAG